MSAPRRSRWLVGTAACLLVPGLLTVGPTGVQAASRQMTPGVTLPVSGSRPLPTSDDPFATEPAVSADGSLAAYTTFFSEDPGVAVVRDVRSGATTVLGTAARGDVTTPSLSGDGTRAAYTESVDQEGFGGRPDDNDVYVEDLGGASPVEHRITGTTTDLRYQRSWGCDGYSIRIRATIRAADRCGPQLSADGRSVALQAQLSLVVPKLRLSSGVGDAEVSYGYEDATNGGFTTQTGAIDFGTKAARVVVTVRVSGPVPVHLDGFAVTGGTSVFAVDPAGSDNLRPCADVTVQPSRSDTGLEANQECTIALTMRRGGACAARHGLVTVRSPTPRGRTMLPLVGDEETDCLALGLTRTVPPALAQQAPADPATAAACPAPLPSIRQDEADPDPGDATVTENFGEVDVDQPRYVVQEVDSFDDNVLVHLTTQGCGVRFLSPDGSIPSCQEGMALGPVSGLVSCYAVLSVTPTGTRPLTADLALLRCFDNEGTCEPDGGTIDTTFPLRTFRFVGAGTEKVAVVRRDLNGDGSFTGRADPPAVQVSVDHAGEKVTAATPSISADGRYVAFASTDAGRFGAPQILVHDTDRRGDGSYRSGGTVTASRFSSGAAGLPDEAVQPSISGDGGRVAYVTRDPDGDGDTFQVRVRDLDARRTVLASAAVGTTEAGNGWSFAPSLSNDGSTVVYASLAQDLTAADDERCCAAVFLRDLGPDFGGPGAPGSEIQSLHPDDDSSNAPSGIPVVDADGGVTLFESADNLLSAPGRLDDQIYARARYSSVSVAPASVAFPRQSVGTSSAPRTIAVANDGAGPAEIVSIAVSGPFVLRGGCHRPTLHRDESCAVKVAFTPTASGARRGRVTLTTRDFGQGDQRHSVSLTGTGVAPLLSIHPSQIAFPDTIIGTDSKPIALRVTNVAAAPLDVTDSVIPEVDDSAPLLQPGQTEFTATASPAGSCRALAPGATCTLSVTFHPLALGGAKGDISVVGALGTERVTQDILVTGSTAQPTVEFSPTVAQEGRVTFVSGRNFMPGVELHFTYDRGPIVSPKVLADADGSFTVPAVILRGAGAGQHALTVSTLLPFVDVVAPPLLVVQGSAQPPDFVSRN